ncbi:hypothetical protein [Breoghania sp. L-A4]|uniref:hypothetical protein n=1 Tax=Breoghania sp. L-A4 TaxID=2304600 RepID=UPI000E359239|nr:hypothetical protein [Breoghania sp. L-A4]AXS39247.1 hypothetical protein D1F64_03275 [Breoghania sp. L-A4]
MRPRILTDQRAPRRALERNAHSVLAGLADLYAVHPGGITAAVLIAAHGLRMRAAATVLIELVISRQVAFHATPQGYVTAVWPLDALPPMGGDERALLRLVATEAQAGPVSIDRLATVSAVSRSVTAVLASRLAVKGVLSLVETRSGRTVQITERYRDAQ